MFERQLVLKKARTLKSKSPISNLPRARHIPRHILSSEFAEAHPYIVPLAQLSTIMVASTISMTPRTMRTDMVIADFGLTVQSSRLRAWRPCVRR